MQYTENHNFNLPEGTDRFNIQHQNDNWESMDTLIDEYLPLSAGESKKLTGDLHFSIPMGGNVNVVFDNSSGVPVAQVYIGDTTMTIGQLDSSGNWLRGLHCYNDSDTSGTASIFTNNGNIVLRPQGQTVTNQVYLDANGIFHNNYGFYTASGGSVSVNSASVQCGTISIPRGMYIIIGMLEVCGTGQSGVARCRCTVSSGGFSQDVEVGSGYGTNFSKYVISTIIANYTGTTNTIPINATVNGAVTVRNWWLRAIRIGY